MIRRIVVLGLLAFALHAQRKYDGPRPPKPDTPYLKHASNLIPTESGTAREEKGKKDEITYIIDGAASPAKTPLASPIFLMETAKLSPDQFGLYKLDVKNGHREITASPKKRLTSIRIEVERLADRLYKIEVSQSLEAGEYSLSPEGSNQVFCFQVY